MNHEEYGQGFVDGFNAALKSDYIKELYQTKDKETLLNRIKELENQLYYINQFFITPFGGYYGSSLQSVCSLQDLAQGYPKVSH